MAFSEFEQYEQVGGTDAGAYYLVEPGVLAAAPRSGYRQTVEGARASLAEAKRISIEHRRPMVVLVLLEPVRDQDRRSRQVWRDEVEPQHIIGLGLVGASPLARALGAFFLGLHKPKVPTVMFATFDDARRWARQLQGAAGD